MRATLRTTGTGATPNASREKWQKPNEPKIHAGQTQMRLLSATFTQRKRMIPFFYA